MPKIFSRILTFLSNVFLEPYDPPVFEELYIDKNDHYKMDIDGWLLDGAFVALAYDGNLRRELGAYKYLGRRDKKSLFLPYLHKCFDLFIAENIDATAIVTSAPLFFFSRWKRGYNQSTLLARDIAKGNNLQFADLIRKTRWTHHQAQLDRRARLTNLNDAFSVRNKFLKSLKDKDVILIDDIVSTGSTANECAKVLKKSGAKRVYGLFIATGD